MEKIKICLVAVCFVGIIMYDICNEHAGVVLMALMLVYCAFVSDPFSLKADDSYESYEEGAEDSVADTSEAV